jgi:nucleotide-binding universal stress UspA family protein
MPRPDDSPLLVAYDGSEGAKAAIDAAARLGPGRPAIVLCVWESVAGAAPAGLLAIPGSVMTGGAKALDAEYAKEARSLAEEGAERLRELGVEASASVEQSHRNVWQTIVDQAESDDAAMVVVGSRGRSGVKTALLGSVSNGVVHHCARPVLVVRAAAE